MPYFAKVTDGKVTQVIAAEKEFFDHYVDTTPGEWIQTSYNTRGGKHYNPETGELSADQSKALRGNYAGIGYIYDPIDDAFIAPMPCEHDELELDENKRWICTNSEHKINVD